MTFMQAQMTNRQDWYLIDGPMGVDVIPADLIGSLEIDTESNDIPAGLRDYCENLTCYRIERVRGFGVRSSAPGYMDCTPWTVYETLAEATAAYNEERAENDEDCPDDEDECADCARSNGPGSPCTCDDGGHNDR
jgi:hypothetical protein